MNCSPILGLPSSANLQKATTHMHREVINDIITSKINSFNNWNEEVAKTSLNLKDIEKKLIEIYKIATADPNSATAKFVYFLELITEKVRSQIAKVEKLYSGTSKYKPQRVEVLEEEGKKVTFILDPKDNILTQLIHDTTNNAKRVYNNDPKTETGFEVRLPIKDGDSAHIKLFKNGTAYGATKLKKKDLEFDLPNLTQDIVDSCHK